MELKTMARIIVLLWIAISATLAAIVGSHYGNSLIEALIMGVSSFTSIYITGIMTIYFGGYALYTFRQRRNRD